MFEGLEEFLSKNRKPSKKKRGGKDEGMFDDFKNSPPQQIDDDSESDVMDKLEKAIEGVLGGKSKVIKGGKTIIKIGSHSHRHDDDDDEDFEDKIERLVPPAKLIRTVGELQRKIDLLAETLIKVFTQLKVKPWCNDANGKPIKKGNKLNCHDGDTKLVLEVGFGFAKLARAGEPETVDGIWLEGDIEKAGFKL